MPRPLQYSTTCSSDMGRKTPGRRRAHLHAGTALGGRTEQETQRVRDQSRSGSKPGSRKSGAESRSRRSSRRSGCRGLADNQSRPNRVMCGPAIAGWRSTAEVPLLGRGRARPAHRPATAAAPPKPDQCCAAATSFAHCPHRAGRGDATGRAAPRRHRWASSRGRAARGTSSDGHAPAAGRRRGTAAARPGADAPCRGSAAAGGTGGIPLRCGVPRCSSSCRRLR